MANPASMYVPVSQVGYETRAATSSAPQAPPLPKSKFRREDEKTLDGDVVRSEKS